MSFKCLHSITAFFAHDLSRAGYFIYPCLRSLLRKENLKRYLIYLKMGQICLSSNHRLKACERLSFELLYSFSLLHFFFPVYNSCGSKRSNNCVRSGASEQAILYDPQQAESLIASGLLKRASAMTNSNNQSR